MDYEAKLQIAKCVTLAPASISHFTSSGGKQFCNDIYIIINKVQVQVNLPR